MSAKVGWSEGPVRQQEAPGPLRDRGRRAEYPGAVVAAFFEVIEAIRAAKDERDLYALKSLHLEALKGDRADQRSVRLNKQFVSYFGSRRTHLATSSS